MDNILREANQTHSYVDNILVHSVQLNPHIGDLRETFTRLRDARVQLRPDKCRLGYQHTEFVGHLITPDSHRPLPSNVEKISTYKPPRSRLELQRFLGLVNFYRDDIPNMAARAEPLYKLTRKGEAFVWNYAANKAFDDLRRVLTTEPVLLAYPDWNCPFYLLVTVPTIL